MKYYDNNSWGRHFIAYKNIWKFPEVLFEWRFYLRNTRTQLWFNRNQWLTISLKLVSWPQLCNSAALTGSPKSSYLVADLRPLALLHSHYELFARYEYSWMKQLMHFLTYNLIMQRTQVWIRLESPSIVKLICECYLIWNLALAYYRLE